MQMFLYGCALLLFTSRSCCFSLIAKSVCEEVIDRNYKQLREHMSVDSLFPYLIQYDLLTMEQRQEILLPVNTSIAKADKVLHFIPQSGPDSIYKFIDALYESRNGTDHGRLANLLKKSISKFSGQRYRTGMYVHVHVCVANSYHTDNCMLVFLCMCRVVVY